MPKGTYLEKAQFLNEISLLQKRHKSSKYNLYVIHVVYLFKLYTTIFVFLRKSKWLPIIYYEIFKINETFKLKIVPWDGNKLAWIATLGMLIPWLVRLCTFPGKTLFLELMITLIVSSFRSSLQH
uniref:Uncharacterized protein n=1 Tax=Cacopsylla melanoneura TaxID=428564 RepID=A0A8D9ECD9_9HEMI